ncbi:erythromycin esterase family protein [Streptomyces marispadix]|uniref:Erythromycin esterase family protein n=1 Tax=Streptomyces marispadix TaxID=2922868 RepID=A0ABS9SVG3_9ACTN|nr:erythromycin esterase family protein [Streptomyces marispadix]MCH6160269.1 erythromycin esterase family protein [Streptomyces marispadix]
MNTTPAVVPTAWTRQHTHTLAGLDVHAGLDGLEPLRKIVGDARVVAIGEGAHFVREFSQVRQRVLRFLAERCGFTVFAFEYSFAAADDLDAWLHGRDDRPLAQVSPAAAEWGAADLMAWLREHNTTGPAPLRFAGVDVPEAGGALRPVLEPLADLLAVADPESEALARRAVTISDEFLSGLGSGAAAAPAWAGLPTASQDELTALLARLELRLSAIEPLMTDRAPSGLVRRAERLLAGARATDYMFGAANDLGSAKGKTADLSVRDRYMAETLAWHLSEAGPEARVVIAAHNNHIQKTANVFNGQITALPMGQHLAGLLGTDYVSVAVTHTARAVPEMIPDPSMPVGFRLQEVPAAEPVPGSIEHALEQTGLAGQATLTDLRQAPRDARGESLLGGIRTQSGVMLTDLTAAFDAVVSVPTVTRDLTVSF